MEGSQLASDPVDPVRVGVIGAGLSASIHLAAMRKSRLLEPVAIGARRGERAASAAIEAGIPLHSDDYKLICRHEDVEAVIIATPPHLHHPIAIAALEHGKHVLCEKPMARNVAEARDMLRIAERVGVVAMLNLQQRFLPERVAIKRLIESGYLGEPQAAMIHVTLSSLNDPMDRPWGWLMEADKAGGMLGATGTQYIDALQWWFGEVSAVAGTMSTMVKHRRLPDGTGMGKVDADDNFAVVLRFPQGMLATVHVTATSGFDGGEEMTFSGSHGQIVLRDGRLWGAQHGTAELQELAIPGEQGTGAHYLIAPTVNLHEIFAQAIRDGGPVSPSFAEGVKVQELVDAISRSTHQGRWIDTTGSRWPMGSGVG